MPGCEPGLGRKGALAAMEALGKNNHSAHVETPFPASLKPNFSESDQAVAHGFGDGLRPVSCPQFSVNIMHLTLDLDLPPVKSRSDLFISTSLRCQSHDLYVLLAKT